MAGADDQNVMHSVRHTRSKFHVKQRSSLPEAEAAKERVEHLLDPRSPG
jgi:hypothetical protein